MVLGDKWKPDKDMGSFYMVAKTTNAHDVWGRSDKRGNKCGTVERCRLALRA